MVAMSRRVMNPEFEKAIGFCNPAKLKHAIVKTAENYAARGPKFDGRYCCELTKNVEEVNELFRQILFYWSAATGAGVSSLPFDTDSVIDLWILYHGFKPKDFYSVYDEHDGTPGLLTRSTAVGPSVERYAVNSYRRQDPGGSGDWSTKFHTLRRKSFDYQGWQHPQFKD